MGVYSVTTEAQQKKWPTWLKWTLRIFVSYLAVLAVILAVTIISILITFTLIVIDGFTNSTSLGAFSETYLVPISEFLWRLFTLLIPGV